MTVRRRRAWMAAAAVVSVVAPGCREPGELDRARAPSSSSGAIAATTAPAPAIQVPAHPVSTLPAQPPSTLPAHTASTLPDAVRSFRADRAFTTVALPVAVRIPVIGVVSELEPLGRALDGAIEVPSWERAGWYTEGPKPGQDGPAVILGHVDGPRGTAVFARLAELSPGDEVVVDRADGTSARFVVERLERHPKDRFPTEAVYGPSFQPTLRLVTCGGAFDRAVGHYRDNVIAFATIAP